MVCGGMVFFLVIFEFVVCFVMVNRGAVCGGMWWKRGPLMVTIRGLKVGQGFEVYFLGAV
jgi:hypothetical protein